MIRLGSRHILLFRLHIYDLSMVPLKENVVDIGFLLGVVIFLNAEPHVTENDPLR